MRTRTRYQTPPVGCTVSGLSEVFTDSEIPSKGWKPCSHTLTRVTAFSKGQLSVSHDYPSNPEIQPYTETYPFGGPGYAGQFYEWRVGVSEIPDPPSDEMGLKAIDVNGVIADLSRSSTNLAECIATMTDTVNLFSAPGRFLKHAMKSGIPVSRKPLKELRSSLDRAGNTWLQGTYGYIPLMHDLQELTSICRSPSKALNKLKQPITRDIRDGTSRSFSTKPRPTYPRYDLGVDSWFSIGEHVEVQQSISRLVRIEGLPNPSFQAMSAANQMATYLGLNDFGRLAWELVPYSFVFDWFSSLGSNIASAAALNGHYAYLAAKVSSAKKVHTVTNYSSAPPLLTSYADRGWLHTMSLAPCTCTVENIDFQRSDFGEGDTSGSTFSNGLSAYRTTTGLALLLGSMGHLTGW